MHMLSGDVQFAILMFDWPKTALFILYLYDLQSLWIYWKNNKTLKSRVLPEKLIIAQLVTYFPPPTEGAISAPCSQGSQNNIITENTKLTSNMELRLVNCFCFRFL
jgi:hypothetical protein